MSENGTTARDILADLEKHRLQLEENVAKLQSSLLHWQTWEIEYEGMKEEILELGDIHSSSDLENIGNAQTELLTTKERRLLLLDNRGNVRQSQQIIGLLSRRIEYVQENINNISSRLKTEQDKYAAVQVLSKPEVRNEEGLPLTEIHEELDEEGNVISSSVSEPGQAAPQLLDSLRKAGVKDLPSNAEDEGNLEQTPENNHQTHSDDKADADTVIPNSNASKTNGSVASEAKASEEKKPRNNRKSVSFTADTKKESLLEHKSKTKIPKLMDGASDEDTPRRQPVIPPNESPEDAALRRQMIQYNMSEINNVVAELNIDDEASDASFSDAGSEASPNDSSLDEEEDQFGRTKRPVLNDKYVAEMRALEQKLNAKAIYNVGPNASLDASTMSNGHKEDDEPSSSLSSSSLNKTPEPPATKSVRFAKELEILPTPSIPADLPPTPSPQTRNPTKSIHAATIVERPYSSTSTAPAVEPNEDEDLDPAMLQQQVRTRYHQMRNLMIQRQGGFTEDPDDRAEVPLTEAEGGPKKVSRFKAARLGRS